MILILTVALSMLTCLSLTNIIDKFSLLPIPGIGGCMYVSGVPGTGKTATVREVMRALEEEKDGGRIGDFRFIDINGMRLTDPRQAYVAIYKELTHDKATADHACNLLDKRFSTSGPRRQATVLLVDELDLLMTPKQVSITSD